MREEYGLARDEWSNVFDRIGTHFSDVWDVTVFGDGPGRIAPMPDALGGDPSTWPTLAGWAERSRQGLLAILRAKAHYFLLPYTVLDYVSAGSMLIWQIGSSGWTKPVGDTTILINLPDGINEAIAKAGSELGRHGGSPSGNYEAMNTAYHEMIHAWMLDSRDEDSEMRRLFDDGVKAFEGATNVAGAALDPDVAFLEAAADYVDERVLNWLKAINKLNDALFLTDDTADPAVLNASRLAFVAQVVDQYNTGLEVQTYGYVDEKPIATPLPAVIRAALDQKLLDGRPLVDRFEETPLAGILAAF